MRVFVSIFSVPPVEAGVGSGYAREVARLRPHLAGIFTDNRRAAETLRTTCGVPRDRVVVVQHPVAAEHRFSGPTTGNDLVLWAGRLDHHKRPDLLGEIAKRLPARTIHVYGVNVLDDGRHLERLRRAPNVSYRGPFCGFDTIETAPYGCFVYTSSWDGLPNVLLEAMKSGLLVVAPDVGGIAEVVDDDSGLLVRNTDEPGAYAEAIERAFRDPETYRRVAENGRRRVAETHTRAAFLETLKTAPGYL
jgi:glycosyltransferase involved in cell wall biosynthesis